MVEGPFIEVFVSANNHDSRDIILSKLIKKYITTRAPSGSGYFGPPVAGYYPISEFWISAKSGWDDPIRPAAKLAHKAPPHTPPDAAGCAPTAEIELPPKSWTGY